MEKKCEEFILRSFLVNQVKANVTEKCETLFLTAQIPDCPEKEERL